MQLIIAFLALVLALPAAAQVAVNPITNRIYVANESADTVSVIDGATGTAVATVAVGNGPRYVAVNPATNRIYVNNAIEASLSVIDGATNTAATFAIGSTGPITINPVTNKIYIVRLTTAATDEVTVFNGATNGWYTMATLSYQPKAAAVNTVTNMLYVAHYAAGHIRAIDGSSTSDHPPSTEIGVWGKSMAIAVNPVTNRIYSLQEDERGPIAVIDGATNGAIAFLTPLNHAIGPKAIAVNPVTNKVYAAFDGEVIVVDGETNGMTFIPSGTGAQGPVALGINMLTNKIYAPNADGTMTIIDGATNTATSVSIPAGATGIGVNPITNRYYVMAGGVDIVDGAPADARQPNPIATTVTPLPSNSSGPDPTLTLDAESGFSPGTPQLLGVYYQLDSEDGPWLRAEGGGPYTASFTGLTPGLHTLHAFAADTSAAPSINTDRQSTPLVGNIVSYSFTVGDVPPPEPGALAFGQAAYSVNENGPQVQVTVTRTGGSDGAASVTWTTTNATALAGSDFGASGNTAQVSGTLSWAAGDSAAKTITVGPSSLVAILDDSTVESQETFGIQLSGASGAELGSLTSTTITVADNDTPPPVTGSLSFGQATYSLNENGPQIQVTVTRTGGSDGAASVTWTTTNATALAGSDFGASGNTAQVSGTLSWTAGDSAAKTITVGPSGMVPVLDDTAVESAETFGLQLSNATGASLGSTTSATLTIADNDTAPPQTPRLRFAVSSISVSETGQNVALEVTREGPTTSAASVTFSTADGTAVQRSDYAAVSGVLQFAAGVTTRSINIGVQTGTAPWIRILNDGVTEPNETFTIALSSPTGAELGSPATATVTITGAAPAPSSVQFGAATASVSEGAGSLTLTLTRTGDTAEAASIEWATANGTAIAGTDFGASGVTAQLAGTVSWTAGQGGSKTLSIPIIDDTAVDGTKTFSVALSNPAGTQVGAASTASVTITDNDAGVAFSAPTYAFTEASGTAVLQVVRNGDPRLAASVRWTASNGTAIAGTDYGTVGSATPPAGTLSWRAGETTAKTITIRVIQDSATQGDLQFAVTLSNPNGTLVAAPSTASVTIADDEVPAESAISFSQAKFVAMEGPSAVATLTATRTALPGGGFTRPASAAYSMVNGTALSNSDYLAGSGTIAWGAGESGSKTFTVTLVDNNIPESAESFVVRLQATSAGATVTGGDATVLIVDDDEDFPSQGAFPEDWTAPSGATAGWSVSNEPGAFEGAYTLRSDPVDDGGSAQVEVTRAFTAGAASFRLRISSEAGFDFLRFYVDGVKAGEWSGTTNTAWQVFSTPLTAGTHTLRWSYEKDGSASLGADAAWIDAVTLPGGP